MAPSGHPALAAALESTARRIHDVPPDWQLRDVVAEPVRYKPGDRCVLRYRLRFGDPRTRRTPPRGRCTLVAKLYRERGEAQAADDLLTRLRAEAAVAWTARPLGVVPGLPLALTEDLGQQPRPRTGALRPGRRAPRVRGGASRWSAGPHGPSPSCTPAASTPAT